MNYSIQFYSDWQVGSGLSMGADVDSSLRKDSNGLPFIPGKTLKGLLRHAAEELAECGALENQGFVETVFGANKESAEIESKTDTGDSKQGAAFFSNASVSQAAVKVLLKDVKGLEEKEQKRSILAKQLYRKLSTTAIDHKTGVAKEHTLRRIEVAAPLCLFASIDNLPAGYEADMKRCLAFVKEMGMQRHRGLGRCKFEAI